MKRRSLTRQCSFAAGFLLVVITNLASQTQVSAATRVLNESGWVIPGLKGAMHKPGTPPSSGEWNGIPYRVSVLVPAASAQIHKVPIAYADDKRHVIVLNEVKLRVIKIRRFEAGSKPYCYVVSGVILSEDPQTGVGGYAGELDLFYYDETGAGHFTIMDTSGPVSPGSPPIPTWARQK